MGKRLKKVLGIFGILLGVAILSSCTASFCTPEDTARIMYTFDKGVSKFYDAGTEPIGVEDVKELDRFPNIYYTSSFDNGGTFLNSVLTSAISSNYYIPSLEYFAAFDEEALYLAVDKSGKTINNVDDINKLLSGYTLADGTIIPGFGYTKFLGSDDSAFGNYELINNKLKEQLIAGTRTGFDVPGTDFVHLYETSMTSKVAAYKSCINTVDGNYGNYGENNNESVYMTTKDWGYAWSKGFLEGLLVYPIAFMADFFTMSFAANAQGALSAGWPQILAIVFITLIVRSVILLATIKPTLAQGKMQELQPQIARLQQKYPNASTNQYEKTRMSQETMALYKKNKINPFSQIIVMIIQFPVFICVWGALSGSAALATGSFLNLNLSTTVYNALINTSSLPSNATGWWTALALFLIMSSVQFIATKFPTWLNKKEMKKVQKLGKSNTADQNSKTMKIMQYVMLFFIIVMGFTLPSAMGVYWIVGAIFSMIQSTIVYFVGKRRKEKGAK
jgi:YidC/Oxa1 family membrane protein insertase